MIKKILIAIDDELPDTSLVRKGLKVAGQLKAKVGLLDVAMLTNRYYEAGIVMQDFVDFDMKRAKKNIAEVKREFPDMDFVDFELVGEPVIELKTVVAEWKPDLLIVGHHRHQFLQRLTENSRERRIVNQLDIPVLVIPC